MPLDICPRVARIAELPAGKAHLIDRKTGAVLGDVEPVQPRDESTQRRAFGVREKEVVVLQTLEHDEPIPIFPDEIETINDVPALNAFQHLHERLL